MGSLWHGNWIRNKQKPDVSSILDSLNESRDDSINSSIFMQAQNISNVPKDTGSDCASHSQFGFTGKAQSTILGSESEVESVFKMGTEKFMGSENHDLAENIAYDPSNIGKTLELNE